jgi:TolB-like protein
MKTKVVLLGLFLMVLFSCSTVPTYYSFDKALETGIHKIENDLPERSNIAILDFKSDSQNLSFYIIEELYDMLINSRKLSIMERNRTDTIAMEVGYQFSGEVDDEEIISIGHQLGAAYVVTGQIAFSGEAYRLRVFAIDIERGRRVASSSLYIKPDDRQINYLLENRTNENSQVSNGNNTGETFETLREAVIKISNVLIPKLPRNTTIVIQTSTIETPDPIMANFVSDELIVQLVNSGKFSVLDKDTRDIENLRFDFADDYQFISANILISGSISISGSTRTLMIRAIDINSGRLLATANEQF